MTGWIVGFYPPAVMISGWCYSENVTMFALICCTCLRCSVFEPGEEPLAVVAGMVCLRKFFGAGDGHSAFRCRRLAPGHPGLDRLPGHTTIQAERGRCGCAGPARLVPGSGIAFSLAAAGLHCAAIAHHVSLNEGWVISTNNELNFFLGNNPFTPNYKTWHLGGAEEHAVRMPGYKAYVASVYSSGPHPRIAMVHEALRYIGEHPGIFLLRTANRIRAFWGADHIAAATVRGGWPRCGKAGFALCPGGGSWRLLPYHAAGDLRPFLAPAAMAKTDVALLIAAVLAYQLPYTISFAYSIYHFPVMGLLFPFAGLALAQA